MDYYALRRIASNQILKMYNAGATEEQIYFHILTNFGLSRKFVRDTIGAIEK